MGISSIDINRRLYPASMVRELDRIAIEEHKIPGIDLMHRAGQVTWDILLNEWPDAKHILVICGGGNNAGDGYVIAKLALEAKLDVTVIAISPVEKLKGDALIAANEYLSLHQVPLDSLDEIEFANIDVIVDAILGTGTDRVVTGRYLKAINYINESSIPVISVDVPSGLDANTGKVQGTAVKSDCTVTFIGQKQGMHTGEAANYCKKIIFNKLDVPPDIYQSVIQTAELVDISIFENLFSPRSRTNHKGHNGHVLIIGGDYGYAGAVKMSGEAAVRTGAGLVSIATRPEHAYTLPNSCPELMAAGISSPSDIRSLLSRATVIAIGPGLGTTPWSVGLLMEILDTKYPLVIDADALNLLAVDPIKRDNWVLTPHPGEAARLLNISVSEVQSDRITVAKSLQQKFGGVIVLKGSGTVIASSTGLRICKDGNPGMATGGMGDVLTGIIAGLIAQGMDMELAASSAVCLHARAGDLSAADDGERGMMATDLFPYIRRLVNFDK